MQLNLAIDVMGGDLGPRTNLAGALLALVHEPQLQLTLVGQQHLLESYLQEHYLGREYAQRFSVVASTNSIAMDASPSQVIRQARNSSMYLAVDLVAQGKCQGVVSAGNTGALMLISRQVLGMQAGIDRPAICSAIPTYTDVTYLLDLGANIDCQPEHLLQFAFLGQNLVQKISLIEKPKIALLSNGHEAIKGNQLVRQAHILLSQEPDLNYQGYIEGGDIFSGAAQVIVCDGFTGNIALKTSEGLAKFLSSQVQGLFKQNIYSRLVGLMAKPLLKQLKQQMDPVGHNGGSFLGLNGCVIKSHGNTNAEGFAYAILRAAKEARLSFNSSA